MHSRRRPPPPTPHGPPPPVGWGGVGLGCHPLWLTRVRAPPPVDCGGGLGWLGWQGCSLYGCPPGGFESMEKQRKHKKSSRKASAATPEKSETIPWGGGGVPMPAAGGA